MVHFYNLQLLGSPQKYCSLTNSENNVSKDGLNQIETFRFRPFDFSILMAAWCVDRALPLYWAVLGPCYYIFISYDCARPQEALECAQDSLRSCWLQGQSSQSVQILVGIQLDLCLVALGPKTRWVPIYILVASGAVASAGELSGSDSVEASPPQWCHHHTAATATAALEPLQWLCIECSLHLKLGGCVTVRHCHTKFHHSVTSQWLPALPDALMLTE